MTPVQQMRMITLGAGGFAGAAVGVLIYAFWPQPARLAVAAKAPVQQPVFIDTPAAAQAKPAADAPPPVPTLAAAPQNGPTPLALASAAATRSIGPIAAEPAPQSAPSNADPQAKALLGEGVALLMQGEVAAARLLLEKAALAGEARAWVALGDSYDPATLAKLGALGVKGDPAKAKECYAHAVSAGILEALDRIAQLGNPPNPNP